MKKLFFYFISLVFLLSNLDGFAQANKPDALGMEYLKNSEFDKAETIFKKLFQNNPENRKYYEAYILCLNSQKKYSESEKIIKKMIKKYDDQSSYYIDLGDLYSLQGDKDKADKNYTLAISKTRNSLQSYNEIIQIFMSRSLNEYALLAIKTSRIKSNDPTLFSQQASKIYNLQNNKKGIIEEQLNLFENNIYTEENIQQTFQDYFSDAKDYDLLRVTLIEKLQIYPDQVFYTNLLIWTFIQQENFDAALFQSIAIDKKLNEDGSRLYNLAEYCKNNKYYDVSIKAYESVINKGVNYPYYTQAQTGILNVRKEKTLNSKYTKADLELLESNYDAYFNLYKYQSSNSITIKEYSQLLALYLNKVDKAIELLNIIIDNRLGTTSFQSACKIDLGDYLLIKGEIWDAALLYGQVDKAYKDEPLGQMAKFKNAKLSYYAGEFEWSKAQLDILKGSTSQLYANDALNLSLLISDHENIDTNFKALTLYSNADLLIFQNKFEEAIIKLDSIDVLFPGNELNDDILWLKSSIDIKKQDFNTAITILDSMVHKMPESIWADDALFTIAELYEQKIQNTSLSMEYYKKIIDEYPGSLYETEARKRFRKLRGS